MTYEEFREALRKTPRDWRIDDSLIRRNGGLAVSCPAMAVFPLSHGEGQSWAPTVYAAADNAPGHDPQIRADLLEDCALTPAAGGGR